MLDPQQGMSAFTETAAASSLGVQTSAHEIVSSPPLQASSWEARVPMVRPRDGMKLRDHPLGGRLLPIHVRAVLRNEVTEKRINSEDPAWLDKGWVAP